MNTNTNAAPDPTFADAGADILLKLIEDYAELRHTQGARFYNADTAAAWGLIRAELASAAQPPEDERKAFEHAERASDLTRDEEGDYLNPCVQSAWEGWQARAKFGVSQPQAGMVMVPAEATEEMKTAAVKYANGTAVYKNVAAEALRIEEGIYGEIYEAMLAATPKAAKAGGVDDNSI